MPTNDSYIVLGAGKQGVAAAYDLILFGKAARVTLADTQLNFAKQAVDRLHHLIGLTGKKIPVKLSAKKTDGRSKPSLVRLIKGHRGVLSALPYYLNPGAAAAAIEARAHYVDLGGHFETTQKILALDHPAQKAGVTLTPDCGVSPGMCNSLAGRGIMQLDAVDEVRMYCGGLPQNPKPPLNYKLVFNLEGVLGNYFGKSYELLDGKVALVPSFTNKEELTFDPPLGKLEAFVTGGATSTCPWTFEGKIKTFAYKTLRYPGHHEKILLLKELGLLDTDPVALNGHKVVPQDLFLKVVEPRLKFPGDRDLLVMRVIVRGVQRGKRLEIIYDVLEFEDTLTGFTAMQRTTGFSAAVVLEMIVTGRIEKRGVVPVERAVPPLGFLVEIRKRGIQVKETIRLLDTP